MEGAGREEIARYCDADERVGTTSARNSASASLVWVDKCDREEQIAFPPAEGLINLRREGSSMVGALFAVAGINC